MWAITGTNGSIGSQLAGCYLSQNIEVLSISASPSVLENQLLHNKIIYEKSNLHSYQDDYTENLNNDRMRNILKDKKIDCLIISSGEYFSGTFLSTKYEDYISNYRANFESCVRYISQLENLMNKNSNIIVLNSIASLVPQKTEGSYAVAKKTISVFIDSIADELKNKSIFITDLVCGAVKSKITKDRENYNYLIEPKDLASQITQIVNSNDSLTVRRIEVVRSK